MDAFITDLASDCCQNTLGLTSDVVAIAPGIAVLQDQDSKMWILCFDVDRWKKRNESEYPLSRSCIMVATAHFLIGIVKRWFCSRAAKVDVTMRRAALRMLEPLGSEQTCEPENQPIEIFLRHSTQS